MDTMEHAKRFSRVANRYTTDRIPGRSQCIQKVLELLDPRPGDTVLDVGCGPGIQLINLSPAIRTGIGVDPAEAMIRRANDDAAQSPNLHFYQGSAETLPAGIRTSGINKIYSNYAIHHLPDPSKKAVIADFASLLPAGGMFILGDMMFSDDPGKHRDLYDYVGYVPANDSPAFVVELEAMFRDADLQVVAHRINPLVGVLVGRKEVFSIADS